MAMARYGNKNNNRKVGFFYPHSGISIYASLLSSLTPGAGDHMALCTWTRAVQFHFAGSSRFTFLVQPVLFLLRTRIGSKYDRTFVFSTRHFTEHSSARLGGSYLQAGGIL